VGKEMVEFVDVTVWTGIEEIRDHDFEREKMKRERDEMRRDSEELWESGG
jgi:hypothetical protein